jgi:hypothetical protein
MTDKYSYPRIALSGAALAPTGLVLKLGLHPVSPEYMKMFNILIFTTTNNTTN